jgi:hypothetical protein
VRFWISIGEQHRVQRLVAVRLRNGNEVAEAAVQWLVQRMDRAERPIAIHRRRCHDAESVHVHDLGEALVLGAHLLVDAVRRLDPADDAVRDFFLLQARGQCCFDLAHRLAAVAEHALDARGDDAVAIGVQGAETQILQFRARAVHAQALRDRRVDVERLARDAAAFFRRHRRQRAHVVQAIGELDQDDAQIARHRQQHLAETLGRGLGDAAETQLVEFGDAIDEFSHGDAERGFDFRARQRRVLERVVQDRRNDRFGIHADLGEDAGNRDRMRDVGLAALAFLPFMGAGTSLVGLTHPRNLILRQIGAEALLQRLHVGRDGFPRRRAHDRAAWAIRPSAGGRRSKWDGRKNHSYQGSRKPCSEPSRANADCRPPERRKRSVL